MFSGVQLRDAVISGANAILNCKTSIDELNIFPVPDGDTGTNMSMTICSARNELMEMDSEDVHEVAKRAASFMLRGARGNSGVILSLLFKGFAQGLEGKFMMDGRDITDALAVGVENAYKAVMKPTEGTILTVARVACETARDALEETEDPLLIWRAVCRGAEKALEDTPRLLPVLKKAGVVDAGGKGLCVIFRGMLSVFEGDGVIEAVEKKDGASGDDDFFRNAAAEFDSVINFTYCTEYIIGREEDKNREPNELRLFLETIGDCVLVADDDDIIKVHVHTENPGLALQKALEFGSLLTIKIENMKEQHRKAVEENEKRKQKQEEKKEEYFFAAPEEEYGFVAVAAGDGLSELFRNLGCGHVVSGGQTMNPSTEDILTAVLATPAKTVYVLPNNKNIIMAAEQAVPLVQDRKIVVVPTRTVPQGMSAMLAFDSGVSVEENLETMMEAASQVLTGQVTFAARDSEFGGKKIKKDDILGLVNGKLDFVEKDPVQTAYKVIRSMLSKSTSFITIIYGEDITEDEAEALTEKVTLKAGSDVEVTLVNGGQPVYYFIISVE